MKDDVRLHAKTGFQTFRRKGRAGIARHAHPNGEFVQAMVVPAGPAMNFVVLWASAESGRREKQRFSFQVQ